MLQLLIRKFKSGSGGKIQDPDPTSEKYLNLDPHSCLNVFNLVPVSLLCERAGGGHRGRGR